MAESISPEKEQNRKELLHAIGECINAWSVLEAYMEKFFRTITGMDALMSQKIFFTLTGFDARIRVLSAAIETSTQREDVKELLKAVIIKSKHYAQTRNDIVHGHVITFAPGYKYSEQYVIVQGKDEPTMEPQESEVLTAKNLITAKQNINRLISCLHATHSWDGKNPPGLALEYLGRVKALPNQAPHEPTVQSVESNPAP